MCGSCGDTFTAKRKNARWCSERCRKRGQRGDVINFPLEPKQSQDAPADFRPGPVTSATMAALTEADRVTHPLGAAALALAYRMDHPGIDTGSAVAAIARQLEATLTSALRGSDAASKPQVLQDELAARRAAHGA